VFSDLPRKGHRHLSGWTEPSVDSVSTLVAIETIFHGKSSAPIEGDAEMLRLPDTQALSLSELDQFGEGRSVVWPYFRQLISAAGGGQY